GFGGVSSYDGNNRALIDFTQGGHLNKILDNIGDGSIYARFLSSGLSSGIAATAGLVANAVSAIYTAVTTSDLSVSNSGSALLQVTIPANMSGYTIIAIATGCYSMLAAS